MDKSSCSNAGKCGTELAQILRAVHPFNTAKLIGRDAGIASRTVERWLDGTSAPSLEHFARLVKAHPSILLVLLPAAPWLEAALTWLEQSELEARLAAVADKRQRTIDVLRGRS